MAIWQYTFHVLPKESVDALSSNYHFKKDEGEFDDEPYWKYNSISRDFFYGINKILVKSISWSNQIDLYGNQESNCFEVFFENNYVISASFRIDFRSNYEKTLGEIIEYCLLNGLVILNEDLRIVPFISEKFKNCIDEAPQVKKYHELSQKYKL